MNEPNWRERYDLLNEENLRLTKEIWFLEKCAREREMELDQARDKRAAILPSEFVQFWNNLNYEQLCLVAAQSLLKAADKVKEQP